MRTKVFISYSHQDVKWLKRLDPHLKPLVRDENIDIWDDRRISAGSEWREEIQKALDDAKVAVLLISADFIASDFIVNHELPALLNAAEEDGVIILSLIIGVSRFSRYPMLSKFQAINSPDKPLSKLTRPEQDKHLDRLALEIEKAINNTMQQIEPVESKRDDVKFDPVKLGDTTPVKILFSDFVQPDPISIKLAVLAFESGQREFVAEWHPENIQLFDILKRLYEDARNYRNTHSKFHSISSEFVMEFIAAASEPIKSFPEKKEKTAKRIPLLLETLHGFYADSKEIALSKFLILAGYNIYISLAYAIEKAFAVEKNYPKHWQHFFGSYEDAYHKLFEINEPMGKGRLLRLGDKNIDLLVSSKDVDIIAPLSMLLYADSHRKPFNYKFILNYLIPQFELFMASYAPDFRVDSYDPERIWWQRVVDSDNTEIDGDYFKKLRVKNASYFNRLIEEGVIDDRGFQIR